MNTTGGSRADFDEWLTRQFSLTLGPERGPRGHPAEAAYAAASRTRAGRLMAVRSSVLAAVSAKAVAVAAAATLATLGAAAAIATGSVKPANWGQQVVQAVRDCQADRAGPGTRGIGQCVSAAARQHGDQQRNRHGGATPEGTPGSPSPLPGKRLGQTKNGPPGADGKKGSPPGAGQGNGQGSGPANAAGAAHGHGNQGRPTPVGSPQG